MRTYLLRRLLVFVPTLFALTLILFWLSDIAPIDSRDAQCGRYLEDGQTEAYRVCMENEAKLSGLGLPLFYVSVGTQAETGKLYEISDPKVRLALLRLARTYGRWELVQDWHMSVNQLYTKISSLNLSNFTRGDCIDMIDRIARADTLSEAFEELDSLETYARNDTSLRALLPLCAQSHQRLDQVKENPQPWKSYLPAFHRHGLQNRYHQWLYRLFVEGSWGRSQQGKGDIRQWIGNAIWNTLGLSLSAALLASVCGLGLGLLSARYANKTPDRLITGTVLGLESVPSIWLATLLLVAGDRIGVFVDQKEPLTLILPLLALSYGGLAFLAGSTRAALLESLSQEYIRTARAAGISETRIYLKLALKNALLPAITTFAAIFAGLIGGSVIIEKVFSLNGMGEKFLQSALSNDTTALLALFPLSALMTMTGFLLADLSYALLDPKIRFRHA